MSKIEIYKKQREIAQRIKYNYLNACGLMVRDGIEIRNSNNDKATIYYKFGGLCDGNWSEIKLYLHLSHGFHGSSSGYSDTCEDTGKYVAQVLNSMGQTILQKAVELAEADVEKARQEAEYEARLVLQEIS